MEITYVNQKGFTCVLEVRVEGSISCSDSNPKELPVNLLDVTEGSRPDRGRYWVSKPSARVLLSVKPISRGEKATMLLRENSSKIPRRVTILGLKQFSLFFGL